MNNLNSILIEGVVVDIDIDGDGDGKRFELSSQRVSKDLVETTLIPVRPVARNADSVFEHLKIGQSVRVIGRIYEADAGIEIIAEHIEFKAAKA